MVANTHPSPNRRPHGFYTHQVVTLRCFGCGQKWLRDQWHGLTGVKVDENLEEVEHCFAGCNGQVKIVHVHDHNDNCRCMIPKEPPPPIPAGPPVRYVRD